MTATTPQARARARELRRKRLAQNPDQLCPPDHRHGETSTCYSSHGCRCDICQAARRQRKGRYDWERNLLHGRDVWVPAVGAMRRLEALSWAGWSNQLIAERMGSNYRHLLKIRAGERVRVRLSTHRRIDKVFRELVTVEAPGHSGRITRGYARKHGFVPAAAWDDIDDPHERARGVSR